MLGCGNGKNMIYNSLRHPPRRLSSFQLSGRLNDTIKKNTGKNTRVRYWQHPRPFGTTLDNRRTSRGNSGFSELLPVASVFGVCGIGLKIYFENKRVAKHNDHEGDGAITLENLRVCMECLIKVIHAARGNGALPANVARAYAERMFIREGLNHDDHLSFNQFLKFIMPYLGKR